MNTLASSLTFLSYVLLMRIIFKKLAKEHFQVQQQKVIKNNTNQNKKHFDLKLFKCSKSCGNNSKKSLPESRKKLQPVFFSEKALNKWGHGLGNLFIYNSSFTLDEENNFFNEAEDLIDQFWSFQQENHKIFIPDGKNFKTNIPEIYHYKMCSAIIQNNLDFCFIFTVQHTFYLVRMSRF